MASSPTYSMLSLQEHWLKYRTSVYKGELSREQEKEMRQAFMAGAFIILVPVITDIALLPNGLAEQALHDISLEAVKEVGEQAISNFSTRN